MTLQLSYNDQSSTGYSRASVHFFSSLPEDCHEQEASLALHAFLERKTLSENEFILLTQFLLISLTNSSLITSHTNSSFFKKWKIISDTLVEATDQISYILNVADIDQDSSLHKQILSEDERSLIELRLIEPFLDVKEVLENLMHFASNSGFSFPEYLQTVFTFCEYTVIAQAKINQSINLNNHDHYQAGDLLFYREDKMASYQFRKASTWQSLIESFKALKLDETTQFLSKIVSDSKRGTIFSIHPLVTGVFRHAAMLNTAKQDAFPAVLRVSEIFRRYKNEALTFEPLIYSDVYRFDFEKLLTVDAKPLIKRMYKQTDPDALIHFVSKLYGDIVNQILVDEDCSLSQVENTHNRAFNTITPTFACQKSKGSRLKKGICLVKPKMFCSEYIARLVASALLKLEQHFQNDYEQFLEKQLEKQIDEQLEIDPKDQKTPSRSFLHHPIPETLKFKHIHPTYLHKLLSPYLLPLAPTPALMRFCK